MRHGPSLNCHFCHFRTLAGSRREGLEQGFGLHPDHCQGAKDAWHFFWHSPLAIPVGYDGRMGRSFISAAVVKVYDAGGNLIAEDIVPAESYGRSGSLPLNSHDVRAARGIRFISFRLFDQSGNRTEQRTASYDLDGQEIAGLHRMPDGIIIENPYI
jgi:hypothetical protein